MRSLPLPELLATLPGSTAVLWNAKKSPPPELARLPRLDAADPTLVDVVVIGVDGETLAPSLEAAAHVLRDGVTIVLVAAAGGLFGVLGRPTVSAPALAEALLGVGAVELGAADVPGTLTRWLLAWGRVRG